MKIRQKSKIFYWWHVLRLFWFIWISLYLIKFVSILKGITKLSILVMISDTYQCGNYAYPPKDKYEVGQYCREYDSQWNSKCWGNSKYIPLKTYLCYHICLSFCVAKYKFYISKNVRKKRIWPTKVFLYRPDKLPSSRNGEQNCVWKELNSL